MGRSAHVEVVAVAYLNSSLERAAFEFVWPRIRLSGGAPYYVKVPMRQTASMSLPLGPKTYAA